MKKIIVNLIISILLLLSILGTFLSVRYYNQTVQLNKKVTNLESKIETQNFEILKLQKETKSDTQIKNSQNEETFSASSEHPIEVKLQNCMRDKNYTTSGMNACVEDSIEDWEKEINNNLALLKKITTREQYVEVQKAQNEWEMYKSTQTSLNEALLLSKQGTIYTNHLGGMNLAIVQNRANELRSLYYFYSK